LKKESQRSNEGEEKENSGLSISSMNNIDFNKLITEINKTIDEHNHETGISPDKEQ